jgi:hypothetical protein
MQRSPLFKKTRLSDYLAERLTAAKQAARQLPEAQLRSIGLDAATADVAAAHHVEALMIHADKMWMSEPEEVDVDVRNHQNIMSLRRGPAKFPGMRYVIHVPFDGNAELFDLQPNMLTGFYPHANVDENRRQLDVTVDVPKIDDPVSQVRAQLDKEVELLSSYVRAQEMLISEFNAKLPVETRQVFAERLTHLDATRAAVAAIGIPLFPTAGAPQLAISLQR